MVYHQFRRWSEAGCFETMVSDMRSIIWSALDHQGQTSAVILNGRILQISCQSGPCAGYGSYTKRNGSKVNMAVDTLGHLIALTLASEPAKARSGR